MARTIYFACIHSRLNYGIEVYGSAKAHKLNKLQVLQNKLMKLLTKKDISYNTQRLHVDLNILKVEDMYKLATLKFVYKCFREQHIPNFDKYFETRNVVHNHDTRQTHQLHTPAIRTDIGRSTTRYTGCLLWNSLNQEELNSSSLYVFKKNVFKKIIQSYDDFLP